MLRIVVDLNFWCIIYYRIICNYLCSDIFFINWYFIFSKYNVVIDLRFEFI